MVNKIADGTLSYLLMTKSTCIRKLFANGFILEMEMYFNQVSLCHVLPTELITFRSKGLENAHSFYATFFNIMNFTSFPNLKFIILIIRSPPSTRQHQ